jgi:hypothetical protein
MRESEAKRDGTEWDIRCVPFHFPFTPLGISAVQGSWHPLPGRIHPFYQIRYEKVPLNRSKSVKMDDKTAAAGWK